MTITSAQGKPVVLSQAQHDQLLQQIRSIQPTSSGKSQLYLTLNVQNDVSLMVLNVGSTVWKFQDFCIFQLLREINFGRV